MSPVLTAYNILSLSISVARGNNPGLIHPKHPLSTSPTNQTTFNLGRPHPKGLSLAKRPNPKGLDCYRGEEKPRAYFYFFASRGFYFSAFSAGNSSLPRPNCHAALVIQGPKWKG